jgi:CspA family cold shock protein
LAVVFSQCVFLGIAEMPQGTIKKLVADRGFGFISSDGGDIFFHLSALPEGTVFEDLHEGQMVEFDTEQGPKGPRAVSLKIVQTA